MANPEHLEILKHRVEEWNTWRAEHSDVPPDLREADLSEARLGSARLVGANLAQATLIEAKLGDADLSRAYLVEANLTRANLIGAQLTCASLTRAKLRDADLSEAHLREVDLSYADLSRANLDGADLRGANLAHAQLEGTDLDLANLSMANLHGARLVGADLADANLSDTDFTSASAGGTNFADVDLSVARGLDTVRHFGRSTIGIDTIYKSGGNIPEVFLRGCGVPDNFIEYMHSLTGQAFEYYSCFISYSTKDQEFAERLHADLQAKGVRCWFAPEDLKIGDKFQERIEESIRWHDKLLLVLSEKSIQSPWVEREVQAGFEREHKSKKPVLFPIRLDETVMETSKAWAADIRRTRHIGEFGQWREHNSYKKALKRLLRDLKAETASAPAE